MSLVSSHATPALPPASGFLFCPLVCAVRYWIGACVGRGSVVGVGSVVGSGVGCVAGFGVGSVVGFGVSVGNGEGDGFTVFGPSLLSATRTLSPGKNKATRPKTAIVENKTGALLADAIGVRTAGLGKSLGW